MIHEIFTADQGNGCSEKTDEIEVATCPSEAFEEGGKQTPAIDSVPRIDPAGVWSKSGSDGIGLYGAPLGCLP